MGVIPFAGFVFFTNSREFTKIFHPGNEFVSHPPLIGSDAAPTVSAANGDGPRNNASNRIAPE